MMTIFVCVFLWCECRMSVLDRLMLYYCVYFFFKQKTACEMRISDWSSDVCSSDLDGTADEQHLEGVHLAGQLADRDRHRREGRQRADHPGDRPEETGVGCHAAGVREAIDEAAGTMPSRHRSGQRNGPAALSRGPCEDLLSGRLHHSEASIWPR